MFSVTIISKTGSQTFNRFVIEDAENIALQPSIIELIKEEFERKRKGSVVVSINTEVILQSKFSLVTREAILRLIELFESKWEFKAETKTLVKKGE